jgi:Matrixin.
VTVGGSGLDAAQITTVFNRVAEDYRPFNINVTTEEAKFLAAPLGKRMRVVLTVNHEWYGISGGVAFVNSFTWTDNTPCFVFTALHVNGAGQYVIKNIAEASAHEAGHTLGLYHQSVYNASCVKIAEYNAGQGPVRSAGRRSWVMVITRT